MKSVSTALANLLNAAITEGATSQLYSIDLYTFTPVNGPVIRICTGDFDAIDNAGNVYSCGSIGSGYPKIDLKQSKVQGKWTRGLDDDQWSVALLPTVQDQFSGEFTYPDVFGSTPWLAACRAGLFASAAVQVARAYWAAPPTPAVIIGYGTGSAGSLLLVDGVDPLDLVDGVTPLDLVGSVGGGGPSGVAVRTCVGSVVIYAGIVGEVDATPTLCFFNCSSYKYLLSMNMPRNLVQASCRHQLFDARCQLSAAAFAKTGVALAGSTQYCVLANPVAPGGSGTYQQGRMQFTSGANSGIQRTIIAWDGASAFQPQYSWPFTVTAGDSVTAWPGCDKSMGNGGCGAGGFNNLVNMLAPGVFSPMPEVQIGG